MRSDHPSPNLLPASELHLPLLLLVLSSGAALQSVDHDPRPVGVVHEGQGLLLRQARWKHSCKWFSDSE